MDDQETLAPPSVPQALGRLRVALNDGFNRASRDVGLTPQQAELLCYVFEPRSIGELAGLLRCDRSNVSHLVDRAVARDLLTRRPDHVDGRISRIMLTDKGDDLARTFVGRLEALSSDLRAQWTPEQTSAAAVLLTEIAESIETPRD